MAFDTEEARRARYREIVQSFTLMDDVFMTAVFQDSLPCVDLVLQIILNRPNIRAASVVTQDTIKNLHGLMMCGSTFTRLRMDRNLTSRSSVRKRERHRAGHAITAVLWMQTRCPRVRTMRSCRNRT